MVFIPALELVLWFSRIFSYRSYMSMAYVQVEARPQAPGWRGLEMRLISLVPRLEANVQVACQ